MSDNLRKIICKLHRSMKPLAEAILMDLDNYERKINDLSEQNLKLQMMTKINNDPLQLSETNINLMNSLKSQIESNEKSNIIIDDELIEVDKLIDECDECASVMTEEGLKMIQTTPELQQCGVWTVDSMCGGCKKEGVKNYQKQKKDREKQYQLEKKEIIKRQKMIFESEQLLLNKKLKDLKKGRTNDYSEDENKQEQMKIDLRKLVKNGNVDSSNFNINLFI